MGESARSFILYPVLVILASLLIVLCLHFYKELRDYRKVKLEFVARVQNPKVIQVAPVVISPVVAPAPLGVEAKERVLLVRKVSGLKRLIFFFISAALLVGVASIFYYYYYHLPNIHVAARDASGETLAEVPGGSSTMKAAEAPIASPAASAHVPAQRSTDPGDSAGAHAKCHDQSLKRWGSMATRSTRQEYLNCLYAKHTADFQGSELNFWLSVAVVASVAIMLVTTYGAELVKAGILLLVPFLMTFISVSTFLFILCSAWTWIIGAFILLFVIIGSFVDFTGTILAVLRDFFAVSIPSMVCTLFWCYMSFAKVLAPSIFVREVPSGDHDELVNLCVQIANGIEGQSTQDIFSAFFSLIFLAACKILSVFIKLFTYMFSSFLNTGLSAILNPILAWLARAN